MNRATMAVIWDVDGTLVDTGELHFRAWQKFFGEMEQPFTRQHFADTFGRRNPEILRELIRPDLTDDEVKELGDRKESYYLAEAEELGIDLLPGVIMLLDGLQKRGVKQAIGSSAPKGNLAAILQLTKSATYFDAVIGQEDTQKGKPDPQVFLLGAQRLGVPPERCLVFEDAVAGVQAAKAGGMRCIAVRFVGHHSSESLRDAGADRIVESLNDVSVDEVIELIDES